MASRGQQLAEAYGIKRFLANLPPVKPDLLLSMIHDDLGRVLDVDSGGKLWSIHPEKRFLPGANGKYIEGHANYKVAKMTCIVRIAAHAIVHQGAGTSLVMAFHDSMRWLPNAEDIVGSTMHRVNGVILQHYGPRRWVMTGGSWICFQGFATVAEADPLQPPPAKSPRQAKAQFPTKRIRRAFATKRPIAEVSAGIATLFDAADYSGWRGHWEGPQDGGSFTTVWTRERRQRAEAVPLSPVGEKLLETRAGSAEATKLDIVYRYALTIAVTAKDSSRCVVNVTLTETPDADQRYDAADVRPESFLTVERRILDELNRSIE